MNFDKKRGGAAGEPPEEEHDPVVIIPLAPVGPSAFIVTEQGFGGGRNGHLLVAALIGGPLNGPTRSRRQGEMRAVPRLNADFDDEEPGGQGDEQRPAEWQRDSRLFGGGATLYYRLAGVTLDAQRENPERKQTNKQDAKTSRVMPSFHGVNAVPGSNPDEKGGAEEVTNEGQDGTESHEQHSKPEAESKELAEKEPDHEGGLQRADSAARLFDADQARANLDYIPVLHGGYAHGIDQRHIDRADCAHEVLDDHLFKLRRPGHSHEKKQDGKREIGEPGTTAREIGEGQRNADGDGRDGPTEKPPVRVCLGQKANGQNQKCTGKNDSHRQDTSPWTGADRPVRPPPPEQVNHEKRDAPTVAILRVERPFALKMMDGLEPEKGQEQEEEAVSPARRARRLWSGQTGLGHGDIHFGHKVGRLEATCEPLHGSRGHPLLSCVRAVGRLT